MPLRSCSKSPVRANMATVAAAGLASRADAAEGIELVWPRRSHHADCRAWLVEHELELIHERGNHHEPASAFLILEGCLLPIAVVAHLDRDLSVIGPTANDH